MWPLGLLFVKILFIHQGIDTSFQICFLQFQNDLHKASLGKEDSEFISVAFFFKKFEE